jgi:chorismate synthase
MLMTIYGLGVIALSSDGAHHPETMYMVGVGGHSIEELDEELGSEILGICGVSGVEMDSNRRVTSNLWE